MGAKRVTADYAVPFRQVWEHLGPLCGLKQHEHALVKTNVLLKRLQRLKTMRKRRKTVKKTPEKIVHTQASTISVIFLNQIS